MTKRIAPTSIVLQSTGQAASPWQVNRRFALSRWVRHRDRVSTLFGPSAKVFRPELLIGEFRGPISISTKNKR